jgi:hypothetical protein
MNYVPAPHVEHQKESAPGSPTSEVKLFKVDQRFATGEPKPFELPDTYSTLSAREPSSLGVMSPSATGSKSEDLMTAAKTATRVLIEILFGMSLVILPSKWRRVAIKQTRATSDEPQLSISGSHPLFQKICSLLE